MQGYNDGLFYGDIFSAVSVFKACHYGMIFVWGNYSSHHRDTYPYDSHSKQSDRHNFDVHNEHEGDIIETSNGEVSLKPRFAISRIGQPIVYVGFTLVVCLLEILVLQNHYRFLRDRKGASKGVVMDLFRDLKKFCRIN